MSFRVNVDELPTQLFEYAKPVMNTYLIFKYANASNSATSPNDALNNYYHDFPHLKNPDRRRESYFQIFGGWVAKETALCYIYPKHFGCYNNQILRNKLSCTNYSCSVHSENLDNEPRRCNSRGEYPTIFYKLDEASREYFLNDDPVIIQQKFLINSERKIPLKRYLSILYHVPVGNIDSNLLQKWLADFHLKNHHVEILFDLVGLRKLWDEIVLRRGDCFELLPLHSYEHKVLEYKLPSIEEIYHTKEYMDLINQTPIHPRSITLKVDKDQWNRYKDIIVKNFGYRKTSRVLNVLINSFLNSNPNRIKLTTNNKLKLEITLSIDGDLYQQLKDKIFHITGKRRIMSKVMHQLVSYFLGEEI